jgi:hypothetical protein
MPAITGAHISHDGGLDARISDRHTRANLDGWFAG